MATDKQPGAAFERHGTDWNWPSAIRDLHDIKEAAYSAWCGLEVLAGDARRKDAPTDDRIGLQDMEVRAYILYRELERRGVAALASWEAERDAQEAETQREAVRESRLILGEVSDDAGQTWRPMTAEERAEAQAQANAEYKQRANANAVADGMAPPYPSEY